MSYGHAHGDSFYYEDSRGFRVILMLYWNEADEVGVFMIAHAPYMKDFTTFGSIVN